MEVDFDEVTKLLGIPALVVNNVPWATNIQSEAMARLRKIEDGLAEEKAKGKVQPGPAEAGQPVAPGKSVPSQPLEAPKSEVAKDIEPEYGDKDGPKPESAEAPVQPPRPNPSPGLMGGRPARNVVNEIPGPAEAPDTTTNPRRV